MINELAHAIGQFDADDAIGAIVVIGNEQAIAAGADYLVVGRPILEAADPRAAAEAIVAEITAAAAA